LFTVFLYTFLHEGGHALAGVLSGGTVTGFNVNFLDLSAHTGMTGEFTPAQTVANNLAGPMLPLLAWLIFILAVPKRVNFALESIKLAGTLTVLNSLLAWIVIPLLHLAGQAPRDDVTNFLDNSGVHPLGVAFAALACFLGGWLLFATRIDGLRREIDLFRETDGNVLTPEVRRTVLVCGGIVILSGLVILFINGFRPAEPGEAFHPPPEGYRFVTRIDLAQAAHDGSAVCFFRIAKPVAVGIYLLLEDIDSEYFEVKLNGPDRYERVIIHGEGFSASHDTPRMEETLLPGEYECILTSQSSAGYLSIYTRGTP